MLHEDVLRRRPEQTGGSLAEVIRAFGHALDLADSQPDGHSTRACYLGCLLGQEIGLAPRELGELFFVLLLKDLGSSANAARIGELFQTDDLHFKRVLKTLPANRSARLRGLIAECAPARPLAGRIPVIARFLLHQDAIAQELVQLRASRGANLAAGLGLAPAICSGIYHLDEHWDGSGRPSHLSGAAIPLYARIAQIAELADIFYIHGGPSAALAEVAARAGRQLDPALLEAFGRVAERERSWADLGSTALPCMLFKLVPEAGKVLIDEDGLDRLAAVFGQVVDTKSAYTAGHSARLVSLVDRVASRLGMLPARRRALCRAAALHDIGKLGIPTAILDKPSGLAESEWELVRGHAGRTRALLGKIGIFSEMAAFAAAHHERLDGMGYPSGLDDAAIARETRIITVCDFYDALTSNRPYRPALSPAEALAAMQGEVGRGIDGEVFAALQSVL
ncbi:HD domain-containing protein [Altererythrobacter sp. CC-YST694]|uniref:HD-GYP domain-containing protein n=1 Tax=Altererythrobacter sp. CC-YST694 TaxID=2755038 RepID=UPI001D00AD85|nr:HD domain-containing phosphohydrolase [Altererythrobacter sp. CC-YST694]MCB5425562.1 HD domain-containing protein [Altererythrobacter sp. CC-YST694]